MPQCPNHKAAAMLVTKQLCKSYRKRLILNQVTFEVHLGEIVGLLGPNGAGKTTCFNLAVGLLHPDAGSVLFDGQDISALPLWQRVHLGLGYLPQMGTLFRELSVLNNLLLALRQHHPVAAAKAIAEQLLAEFSLQKLAAQPAGTLSGGEQRRLELARALSLRPKVLLLDEPFAGVDPIAVGQLRQLLQHVVQNRPLGILLTDHNAHETLRLCHRVYLLIEGSIRVGGTPQTLLNSKQAREHYLGLDFTS